MKDILKKSLVYKDFYKELLKCFSVTQAKEIWNEANSKYALLSSQYADIDSDSKMMILPAVALYEVLQTRLSQEDALTMLKNYGKITGEKIAKTIYAFTSIPFVSRILWKNMPYLMRKMSGPEKGYIRKIVSEDETLVGVDILSCPLHNVAVELGVPEIATVVCAMDKAYMSGFKYIRYTRTTSVAEGDICCDYRLFFDRNKL